MRTIRLGLAIGVLVPLLAVLGCGEETVGPKKQEYTAEREALIERMARKKGSSKGKTRAAATVKAKRGGQDSFSGMGPARFSYDPVGKRDPFRSFEWERPDRQTGDELRGPLEKFDLSQLDLVAVVWNTGNAKALVKDPAGQSYIIGDGTRIGKNEGRVLQVDDNRILVKETYVDHLGQKSTKDIEMRIRGSEGG